MNKAEMNCGNCKSWSPYRDGSGYGKCKRTEEAFPPYQNSVTHHVFQSMLNIIEGRPQPPRVTIHPRRRLARIIDRRRISDTHGEASCSISRDDQLLFEAK